MFSKRSVSVQPSAPPIEYAFAPEARSVFAAVRNCGNVAQPLTPAFLNALTLIQIVDLLAPLKKRPYSFPLNEPRSSHTGLKFAATTLFAKVIGFAAPRFANWAIRPG